MAAAVGTAAAGVGLVEAAVGTAEAAVGTAEVGAGMAAAVDGTAVMAATTAAGMAGLGSASDIGLRIRIGLVTIGPTTTTADMAIPTAILTHTGRDIRMATILLTAADTIDIPARHRRPRATRRR